MFIRPQKYKHKLNYDLLKFLITLFRPLVKSVYQKINFLISRPKHMFWVLNERVLLSTQNICSNGWIRKYLKFYAQKLCLSKSMIVIR